MDIKSGHKDLSNTNNNGKSVERGVHWEARVQYNHRYPNGNTEYRFFDMAFTIIDSYYGVILNLQQSFRSSKDNFGQIDLKQFLPLFKMYRRAPGYFNGIRNVGHLLLDVSLRRDIRDPLRELIQLAKQVVDNSVRDLRRGMRCNYSIVIIDGHKSALELWRKFVIFIDWIINGRKGTEPLF